MILRNSEDVLLINFLKFIRSIIADHYKIILIYRLIGTQTHQLANQNILYKYVANLTTLSLRHRYSE